MRAARLHLTFLSDSAAMLLKQAKGESISWFACGCEFYVKNVGKDYVCDVVDKKIWYSLFLPAEGCDMACARRRSEKRLRKTIRTLRKSINREQFHLHFAGSEYELSKKLVRTADTHENCGTGQVLLDKRCGEQTVMLNI